MSDCVFGTEYDYDSLKELALARVHNSLKASRERHSIAVAAVAVKLAEEYGVDVQKAEIAGILHDIARNLPVGEMNGLIDRMGLDRRYINNVNLAHSKVAVQILSDDFGISDSEILNAVSYHTTGRTEMTRLDMVVFLADAIEPGRNYPGIETLRKLADTDLIEACIYSLQRTIDYVNARNGYLDPDTVRALEYCKREKNS